MTINRSERPGFRVCRMALLVALAAPLMANADDSFSGTIDKDERVAGRKASAGHAVSWNELSKTDHHDLRDTRIARSIPAPGLKLGHTKGGGSHHAPIASPVPEPETWLMALLGLAAVGFWARRRI